MLPDEQLSQVGEVTDAADVATTGVAKRSGGDPLERVQGAAEVDEGIAIEARIGRPIPVGRTAQRGPGPPARARWPPAASAAPADATAVAPAAPSRSSRSRRPSRSPWCRAGPARCPSKDCSSVVSSRTAGVPSTEIASERSETVAAGATSRRPVSVTICRRAARNWSTRRAVAQRPSKLRQYRCLDARLASARCRRAHSGEQ